ncbi:MAG: TM2 domain-containing protein [Clostridia bacterium]|nr:TM2 domain-containing protein [Clostridia bacterium]MBQ9919491.1 TM2 domain-containing protein [Clostridia bacterium]
MFCRNCGEAMNDNQAICLKCGVKTGTGNAYCANCGNAVAPNADVCLNCGVAIKNAVNGDYLNGKDKVTMALICFFLGGLGIHNFMLGETKKGIVKIVLSFCFYIGSILALIDFIKILTDKYVVDPDKAF